MVMSVAEIAAKAYQGNERVREGIALLQQAKQKFDEAGSVFYGTISDKLQDAVMMTRNADRSMDEAISMGQNAIQVTETYIASI